MANLNPRGLSKDPIAVRWGWIQLTGEESHIEQVVLGTSLGCEDFADDDWVGCFNVRAIGEGGVAASSLFGITSQSTTCFYFMHPILRTDFVDFMLFGRAA